MITLGSSRDDSATTFAEGSAKRRRAGCQIDERILGSHQHTIRASYGLGLVNGTQHGLKNLRRLSPGPAHR